MTVITHIVNTFLYQSPKTLQEKNKNEKLKVTLDEVVKLCAKLTK